MLQLRIIKGPAGIGRQFGIEPGRPLIIGRAEDCTVQLPGNGISKKHCRLSVLPGARVEVEDLGSSNGTFVNGLLIKKHIMKPGDILTLNPFMMQMEVVAPKSATPQAPPISNAFNVPSSGGFEAPGAAAIPAGPETTAQKVDNWLSGTVYPLADRLSGQFDVRALFLLSFLVWAVLIVVFTAFPFSTKANDKVVDQAVETARLYARQLARINGQAIIDQRYTELIAELDARTGQTPGIVKSRILDATKAQVLAPPDLIGQPLGDKYERTAITKNREHVQRDGDGYAYVSVPIKVGTAGGDIVSAVAYVQIDTIPAQFSPSAIVEQALNSILWSLGVSFLLVIFMYRWLEGSVQTVAARVDEAMKKSETSVVSPVRWPAMAQLCEQVSAALGRAAGGGGGGAVSAGATQWAISASQMSPGPAAAFDQGLVVIGWNQKLERLVGVRQSMAMGAELANASRDVAFEATIRELAAETAGNPWTPSVRDIEFSGTPYKMAMVYGDGAHLVTVAKADE